MAVVQPIREDMARLLDDKRCERVGAGLSVKPYVKQHEAFVGCVGACWCMLHCEEI